MVSGGRGVRKKKKKEMSKGKTLPSRQAFGAILLRLNLLISSERQGDEGKGRMEKGRSEADRIGDSDTSRSRRRRKGVKLTGARWTKGDD